MNSIRKVTPKGALIKSDRVAMQLSQDAVCARSADRDGTNRELSVETLRRAEKSFRVTFQKLEVIAECLGYPVDRYLEIHDKIVTAESIGSIHDQSVELRLHHLDDDIAHWTDLIYILRNSFNYAFPDEPITVHSPSRVEHYFSTPSGKRIHYKGYSSTSEIANAIRWNITRNDIFILDIMIRETDKLLSSTGAKIVDIIVDQLPNDRIAFFSAHPTLFDEIRHDIPNDIQYFTKTDINPLLDWLLTLLIAFETGKTT